MPTDASHVLFTVSPTSYLEDNKYWLNECKKEGVQKKTSREKLMRSDLP
jgi:hypothetical protein